MPTRIELAILEQFLNFGSLTITVANGRCDCLKGKQKGPDVAIHLKPVACSGVFCFNQTLLPARPIWMEA